MSGRLLNQHAAAGAALALRQDLHMLARAAAVLALLAAVLFQINWSGLGGRAEPPLRLASVVIQPAPETDKITARIEPFRPASAPAAPASAFVTEAAAAPAHGPVTESFGQIEVIDAQTLRAGSLILTLAGASLPARDALCRRLDGRAEPCWERARTQLELATRYKSVTCTYAIAGANASAGECRAGGQDLAKVASRLKRV